MINSMYLAWMTCAGLHKLPQTDAFYRMVEEGRISSALNHASQQALQTVGDKSMASMWSRCAADMAFLIGRAEEANAHFQRSLVGITGSDAAFNVLHMAAMRALGKGDVVNAIRHYEEMTHEQFDASKKCEGLAGMSLLCLSLADIETATTLAQHLVKTSSTNADWAWLGYVIQLDIRVKNEWHQQPIFRDHVYGRQDVTGFEVAHHKPSLPALCQPGMCEPTLSQLRRKQLDLQVPTVASLSIENLSRPYAWSARDLSKNHLVNTRIEQIWTVLGRHTLELLPQLLALFDSGAIMSSPLYSDLQRLELSYFFYKLCNKQADILKASAHYRNYLILSANRIRSRADVAHCCEAYKSPIASFTSDDVSARLPARYRRAYQYMQANLDQNDLSVQDIADIIDVSARALQQAFKKYLGESPTEVLRRRRIEHVHGALLHVSNDTLIMDVAKKFGIKNRTTLTSEYRKLYAELPSRTLRLGAVYAPR